MRVDAGVVGRAAVEEVARGLPRLRWAGVGHPAPVVLGERGRLVDVPGTTGRPMLGVVGTRTRGETVVELRRGATVLLHTDGRSGCTARTAHDRPRPARRVAGTVAVPPGTGEPPMTVPAAAGPPARGPVERSGRP